MSFSELQARLAAANGDVENLVKSIPTDEPEDDTGAADGEPDGDVDTQAEGDEPEDGDDPVLGKSFALTLEDGTVIEAQDGSELVKALIERNQETNDVLEKSIGTVLDLFAGLKVTAEKQNATIAKQADLIKSLQDKVSLLGNKGAGRVATVQVLAKTQAGAAAAKKQGERGVSREQLLTKAIDAQRDGRLTGLQVATLEADLNAGRAPSQELLARLTD